MSSSSTSRTAMPEDAGAREGQDTCEELAPIVVRRPPRRAEPTKANQLFAATVNAWGEGKHAAAAEHLQVNESNVSRMCSGEKSPALHHFLSLFEGCPEAFIAFCAQLCDELGLSPPQPKADPTFGDVKADCTAWVRMEALLWKLYVEGAKRRRGWSAQQIEMAITAKATEEDEP